MDGDGAATNYLQEKTYNSLYAEFKPVISDALNTVGATKYWGDAIGAYNKIPLVKKVNPDLVDYANTKALSGLFAMVKVEEDKIRDNVASRSTELLKKVFGYYDQNKK